MEPPLLAALVPPARPARSALPERYAGSFDTVEVDATLCRLISREAVARRVAQTPQGFTFAVKASRYLTHVRRPADTSPRYD